MEFHPIRLQVWLALFTLGLTTWLTITYFTLLVQISTILLSAFLLSLAIYPLADQLSRLRVPRGLTVLGVYVGLIGLFSLLGDLVTPLIEAQAQQWREHGPALFQDLLNRSTTLPWLSRFLPSLNALSAQMASLLDTLFPTLLKTAADLGDLTLNLLVILVLTYFLVVDSELSERFILTFAPATYRPHLQPLMARLRFKLTRWIGAQVAIVLYFGIAFGLALALLGVPHAFTIALIGAVIEIIPYVGGLVSLLLGVLGALTVNPWLALWVFLIYLVITQVQAHVVAPALFGAAIDLHPALIVIAIFAGAKIGGIVGVFFAVPVTVIITTLVQEMRIIRAQTPADTGPLTSEVEQDPVEPKEK